jgi:hypothetical protein
MKFASPLFLMADKADASAMTKGRSRFSVFSKFVIFETLFCPPYGAVDCTTNGAFRHIATAK